MSLAFFFFFNLFPSLLLFYLGLLYVTICPTISQFFLNVGLSQIASKPSRSYLSFVLSGKMKNHSDSVHNVIFKVSVLLFSAA